MMKALPTYRPSQTMVVESLGPVVEVRDRENKENEDSPEEMDDDSEEEEEEAEELVGYKTGDGIVPHIFFSLLVLFCFVI